MSLPIVYSLHEEFRFANFIYGTNGKLICWNHVERSMTTSWKSNNMCTSLGCTAVLYYFLTLEKSSLLTLVLCNL